MPRATPHTEREDQLEADEMFGKLERDVFTPEQLSKRLGIGKHIIMRGIREGNLRAIMFSANGPTRITRRAALAWLEGRRLPNTVGDADNAHTLSAEAEP